MAQYKNASGLEYEDYDENEDVLKPYDSVASRPPIPDGEEEIQGPSSEQPRDPFQAPNAVRDHIAQKFASPAPQPQAQDPLMTQFDSDQADNQEFQGVQNEGNLIGNLARSFAQAAQGSNETKPNTGLFDAMDTQRSEMFKNRQNSQTQRSKIMQAIEAKKLAQSNVQAGIQSRESIANQSHLDRVSGMEATRQNNDLHHQDRLAQIDATKQNQDANREQRGKALDNRIETGANSQAAKETETYVSSLDAAKRLRDVLTKIKSGELISGATLESAINADIAKLLSNSKTTTGGERMHGEISALSKAGSRLVSWVSGHPKDRIPQPYIDQYEKELEVLTHSVLINYENKVNELKSGTNNPRKQEIFQNRFESQRDAQGRVSVQDSQTVKVRNPKDGSIRVIPIDQLEAALASGGSRVE